MGRALLSAFAVLAAASAAGSIGAAGTASDQSGTMVLNGQKVFPIVLAKGPDAGAKTPSGGDALAEVAAAGVTFLKIGPATVPWTPGDIADANAQDRAAAASGLATWVNLSTVAKATAGSPDDQLLEQVVGSLKADPGGSAVGVWKGADEPLWSGIPSSSLTLAYCRATGRGEAGWCGGEPWLDTDHQWVTIEAPRGTATQLQPYSSVTDVHGVDIYPVTLKTPSADLHQVGRWTSTLASITPSRAVWTTIQVCASGSYDTTGAFVLPTFAQERYMAYDAIINGARSLAFYGGNIAGCWSASDRQLAWNWTFWSSVLKPLIAELRASSSLAPALVAADTNQALTTSDASTQAISRRGTGSELWVIAARSGAGSAAVTIGGLPPEYTTGTVYTENRSIAVADGSFTDDFPQWGVHVYRLVPASPAPGTTTSATTTAPATTTTATTTTSATTTAPPPTTTTVPTTITATTTTAATSTAPVTTAATTTTAPPPPPPPPPPPSPPPPSTTTEPPPPPSPPPTPPPAPGGMPNLAVSLAPSTTPAQTNGLVEVSALVRNTGTATALGAHLDLALPAGLALAGAPSFDRGPGCTGTQQIDCNLSDLPSGAESHVVVRLRSTAAGRQTITATVSADRDADPTDSAVSVAVDVVAPATPPAVVPTTHHVAHTFSGTARADLLIGTSADDVLYGLGGADVLRGRPGNDVLYGGRGNDVLDGGLGADRLFGGPGNDTLRARDGGRDLVDCGPGRDVAIVDRIDRVSGCELVRRPR